MQARFSKREKEILNMMAEGVKSHKVIAANLEINDPKQVSVHLTNARRKVVAAKRFYQSAMKNYGKILFPGTKKKYKGI